MTHDELLERINELSLVDELDFTEEYLAVKAIRAVVELHKPLEDSDYCEECWRSDGFYPCETIQAIEKELL